MRPRMTRMWPPRGVGSIAKAEHFLVFVGIAASLIGYRRLAAPLRA